MRGFEPPEHPAETVTAIRQLHRHGSYVGFVRPFAGGRKNFSLEDALLPFAMLESADYIEQRYGQGTLFDSEYEGVKYDAYMTINGLRPYRPMEWQPGPDEGEVVTRDPENRTPKEVHTHFRALDSLIDRLTSVWADIDCYKVGLEPRHVLDTMEFLVDSGVIPEPSSRMRSGQGVWFHWFLADRTGTAPRATEQNKETARKLNRRLIEVFDLLGSDPTTGNLNRIMRVPNSVHTKAGERVSYWVRQTGSGPATYSLDQLNRSFQGPAFASIPERIESYLREQGRESSRRVILRKGTPDQLAAKPNRRKSQPRPDGQPINRKKQAAGIAGQKKVHHVRRSVIEFKAQVWGGVPEGRRNAVLLYYAAALFHSGAAKEETALFRMVRKLPVKNPDTLERGEVRKVVRSAMKSDPYKPIRYALLAELLDLTEEESNAFFTETGEPFPTVGETIEQARKRQGSLTGIPRRRSILKTELNKFRMSGQEWPGDDHFRKYHVNPLLQEAGEKPYNSLETYRRDKRAIGEVGSKNEGTPTSLEL